MPTAEELAAEFRQRKIVPQELFPEIPSPQVNNNINPITPSPVAEETVDISAANLAAEFRSINQQQPQVEQPGIFSRIADLFTGESRTTPEIEKTPEFRAAGFTSGNDADDFNITRSLYFSADDETKKDIIRDSIPGVTIQERDGVTFIEMPDGKKSILNKPGLTPQDVAEFFGDMALFSGAASFAPAAAGIKGASLIARGLKSLASTVKGKSLLAGAGAAATELARESFDRQLGSEQPISGKNIASAGVLGGASEVVAPAAKFASKKIRQVLQEIPGVQKIPGLKTVSKKLGVEEQSLEEAAEVARSVKGGKFLEGKSKIDFFGPQLTLDPASLQKQSLLQTLSPSSRQAASKLKKQNKQTRNAINRLLNHIAPPQSVETAGQKIKGIAEQAIETKKTLRAEKASPFYTEAKKNKSLIELPKTKELIKAMSSEFAPDDSTLRIIKRAQSLIIPRPKTPTNATQVAVKLAGKKSKTGFNTTVLHNSKVRIGELIEESISRGRGNEAAKLTQIKQSLVDELGVSNPVYEKARAAFELASPAVKELEESIIGNLARRTDPASIDRIALDLFKPGINPSSIANAKKIVEEIDPQAWRSILRSAIEQRLGKIKGFKESESVTNLPANVLNKLFGNDQQRRVLFAGFPSNTSFAKNALYLEKSLKRASKGRALGSQTATNEQIKQSLVRETKAIRAGVRNILDRPAKSTGALAADILTLQTKGATFDAAVRDMADLIFNPKWEPQMKLIRKLSPDSPEAISKFRILLKEVAKTSIKTTPQALRSREGE